MLSSGFPWLLINLTILLIQLGIIYLRRQCWVWNAWKIRQWLMCVEQEYHQRGWENTNSIQREWKPLRSITTDDGKNTSGAEKGFVGQIYNASENVKSLKWVVVYFILFIYSRYFSDLTFIRFMSFVKIKLNSLTWPTTKKFNSLAVVKFYCDFLNSGVKLNFFWEKNPQTLLLNFEWI